jgi:hypothetical protein
MKYQLWLVQLSLLIRDKFQYCADWEQWDEWRDYFNQGSSPEEALNESHRPG